MPKSKYPDKLDTSIEIPAVRDNIVEVGSDVLNSLRSAIFQIEKTLGINPQGAVGNTVSDRINKALDGNGNILKEALDRSNVLSGPITDVDISKVAAINESKLRLNYPTQLLQDELSQLINEVSSMLATIEELSVLFNAHVHTSATNRHLGQAITIEAIDSTTSSTGIVSVEATTSQAAFESIFQSHINYDGSDISLTNRSHEADQLFFDNADSSAYIDSEDIQGAIEETLSHAVSQMAEHQNNQHNNSMDRYATIISPLEITEGVLVLDDENIQYLATTTGNTDEAVFVSFSDTPDAPGAGIKKSDILKITDDSGSYEYQINKAIYSDVDGTLEQVEVFARFIEDSDSSAVGKIYRNLNIDANFGGLLVSVREYESGATSDEGVEISNADILQISNPDAATIITKNIRPSEITAGTDTSNRYFDVSVDGGTAVSVDVYDGTVSVQTIDTILKKLNESFSANGTSAHAYRVDYDEGKSSEIAIVHSIPSSSEVSYTLEVSRGTDDALDSLGLSDFEDLTIDAGLGTTYYIQGQAHNGLNTKLEETDLTFLAGTTAVTATTVDFEEEGICEGDLLVIAGSDSDDGTFVITNVQSGQITLDSNQFSEGEWVGVSSDETNFYIYNNSISLNGLEFDATISGDSEAYVVDVFMDYDRSIFYNVRLKYGTLDSTDYSNVMAITDFAGDVSVYTEDSPGTLTLEKSVDDNPLLSLDGGPQLELGAISNAYIELASGAYDIKLTLFIEDVTDITDLTGFGDSDYPGDVITINGSEGINEEENLLLARVSYNSVDDRVAGAGSEFPRVFSKLRRGGTGQNNLGTDAIYANQQRPLKETRSNGVISGLGVTVSDTPLNGNEHYVINLDSGVCHVRGRRFELDAKIDLVTGISGPDGTSPTTDKFFVAIDQWGGVVFASAGADGTGAECASPFDPYDFCVLCTVEYDGGATGNPPVATDLRLFIDQLDFKLLNSITVSPQRGMGHFDNIGDAIKYAKRFSEAYTKAGTPTIHLKAGVHKVIIDTGVEAATDSAAGEDNYYQAASDYGLWINFPVNIVGEGNSTILDIQRIHSDEGVGDDDRASSNEPGHEGFLPIAGPGLDTSDSGTFQPTLNTDVIESGFVTLSNFRMRLCSIWILDPIIYTDEGYGINWGVNIDNVIFDQTEKTGFDDTNLGVTLHGVDTADTDYIGNVKISNCQFLNSHIKTRDWEAVYHKNISILHNVFSGDGAGNPDPGDHYGIYINGTGHIFGFDTDDPPHENNIRIVGNVYTDDDGAATIDPSGEHLWGDRIGRLGVSDLTIDGSISATMTDLVISKDGDDNNPHLIIHEDQAGTAARLFFTNNSTDYEWRLKGEPDATNSNAKFEIQYADADGSGVKRSIVNMTGDGRVGINTNPESDSVLDIKSYDADGNQNDLKVLLFAGTDGGGDGGVEINGYSDSGQVFGFGYDASEGLISIGRSIDDHDFVIAPNGNVGIGTLAGDSHDVNVASSSTSGAVIMLARLEETAIASGSELGRVRFKGSMDDGVNFLSGASIVAVSTEDWTSSSCPSRITLKTTAEGSVVNSSRLTIDEKGWMGLGDTTPNYPFEIAMSGLSTGSYDYLVCFDNEDETTSACGLKLMLGPLDPGDLMTTNRFINFKSGDDTSLGRIYADGGSLGMDFPFTGGHPTVMQIEDFKEGLVVESTGELWATRTDSVSTAIPRVILSSSDNSKTVFGVVSEKRDSHPGYQRIYGVSEGEVQVYINGLGEGKVWVTDKSGNIENGDYITTSVIPGYGMLQADDILRNYTVAKCTQAVDWSQVAETIDHDGLTYKKYLIACTYHCS